MKRLRHWALTSTICASVVTPATLAPVALTPSNAVLEWLITGTVPVIITATVLTPKFVDAELPVIDVSAIAINIQQFAQMIKSYVVDVNNWLADLNNYFTSEEELATQLKLLATTIDQYLEIVFMAVNFIHEPSFGAALGLLAMAGLRIDLLPLNPYALQGILSGYRDMDNFENWPGVLSNLTNLVNTSHASDTIYTCSDNSFKCKQLQERSNAATGNKGAMTELYSEVSDHNTALNGLRTTALGASDPKTVADVNAQATIENAWSTNTVIRALTITGIAAAQRDLIENQGGEQFKKSTDAFLAAVP